MEEESKVYVTEHLSAKSKEHNAYENRNIKYIFFRLDLWYHIFAR